MLQHVDEVAVEQTTPRITLRAVAKYALAAAVIAALAYAFRGELRKALPLLRHAQLWDVAIGTALIAVYYLTFVLGWKEILRAYGIRLSYRDVLGAEMLSMLAKYIPGGVWTPAARVVAVRRAGAVETSVVVASVLLEAGLSAIAGVLVLGVGMLFVPRVEVPLWPILAFTGFVAVLMHPRVFAPLATKLLFRLGGGPIKALPWITMLRVLAFYCGTWLIGGTAFWYLLRAVGDEPTIRSIVYLGGVTDVGAIAAVVFGVVPSGLGVREAIVTKLASVVVPEATALAAVAINRLAITAVEAALLGVAALLRGYSRRR